MEICDKNRCYGCGACAAICGRKAITMKADERGFLIPEIDENQCKTCGLCLSVCPNNRTTEKYESIRIYAAKSKNIQMRKSSQSGGAFGSIAECILLEGGVVYGAAIVDNEVKYVRVVEAKDLECIQKSKYVQADMNDVYRLIREDLCAGKTTVFGGTPCYVESLKSYLNLQNADTDRLICVEILCYGVPSPKLLSDFLSYEEAQYNRRVSYFVFRDKEYGNGNKFSKIVWDNGEFLVTDRYLKLYSTKLFDRECCATCNYRERKRIADITLGDFWGIDDLSPVFDDNWGVSLVMINTKKADEMFISMEDRFDLVAHNYSDAAKRQIALTGMIEEMDDRKLKIDEAWHIYKIDGFAGIMNRYARTSSAAIAEGKNQKINKANSFFIQKYTKEIVKRIIPSRFRMVFRKVVKNFRQ